ncbi:uncharacterized protein L969DRAFT_85195 [Mixia osmundae IAM 14324]|uniref:Transcription factor CBF/NF-Y/archaeal histone domain-containing protein n=1 Tax=Mixia osmundae (strain CBS 9802 / IAM 14324 / JCM 22182 / KY 12970) TaxID=764103 RepID=G7DY62_MIXOS|nr:uncharacterized protein L969DRAFT_85195 [Mixia osmundae IAM 14324]KEI41424.1 hypothetical protein L969DRAFT_85195 [Mixia osmundae IAM 14324]GAA95522.1 hypothetical protein E5Q_02177 [Mixia osmundae IAM 14324]
MAMKRGKGTAFPVARIKKIMQQDEEVGKVAASAPVAVSKALEMFLQDLLEKSLEHARSLGSRKITNVHLKHVITEVESFDFLADAVAHIPDAEDKPKGRPSKRAKTTKDSTMDSSEPSPKPRKAKLAAPRAMKADADEVNDEPNGDSDPRDHEYLPPSLSKIMGPSRPIPPPKSPSQAAPPAIKEDSESESEEDEPAQAAPVAIVARPAQDGDGADDDYDE